VIWEYSSIYGKIFNNKPWSDVWLGVLPLKREKNIMLKAIKGIVHPKMKIKSLITYPHAVPTP